MKRRALLFGATAPIALAGCAVLPALGTGGIGGAIGYVAGAAETIEEDADKGIAVAKPVLVPLYQALALDTKLSAKRRAFFAEMAKDYPATALGIPEQLIAALDAADAVQAQAVVGPAPS